MHNMQAFLGRSLLLGIVISFIIIISGGILYLINHTNQIIDYHIFYSQPKSLTSFSQIFHNALQFEPLAIIQAGIFVLLLVQILRVLLSGIYFIKTKDIPFVGISAYMLIFMIASLWPSF